MTSKKLWDSGTFKFSVSILIVGLMFVLFGEKVDGVPPITASQLLETAVSFVGIFAVKEGFRYGSEAYKGRGQ